ncbi:MAG: tRNA (5-methylaminomethyl-2-thiouridine)(34)-methyltransferase MnmD [Cyclobacteriaceae bacterium]
MTAPNLQLIMTNDGSKSILRTDIDEAYHSTRGAMGESLYVFIDKALNYFHEATGKKNISILEVGLGTGLNALLTAKRAASLDVAITYYGLEPFPVPSEIFRQLDYGENDLENAWLQKIHDSKWEELVPINDHLSLQKFQLGLEDFSHHPPIDLVYFDAFAPSKQAALWDIENLRTCYQLLEPQGVLTTYCAQGQFKRNMAAVGFEVQTLPGALGKKEMVRGVKL